MTDRHERSFAPRCKDDIDKRLLIRLEVHATPFEFDVPRRIPRCHAADIDCARPFFGLERLEQAPAEPRLKKELPCAAVRDSIPRPCLPPAIDLGREDIEGVLR